MSEFDLIARHRLLSIVDLIRTLSPVFVVANVLFISSPPALTLAQVCLLPCRVESLRFRLTLLP